MQFDESDTAEEERNWEQLCELERASKPQNYLRKETGPTDMLSNIRANIHAFYPNSSLLCRHNCLRGLCNKLDQGT